MGEKGNGAVKGSQTREVAMLLALVGGFLDAYTYFARGGVFANAQTGNIVRLGIALATGDAWWHFLVPIGSFVAGTLVSMGVEAWLTARGVQAIRRTVLAVEAVVLACAALLPQGGAWDVACCTAVSFVCAMQVEAFRSFEGQAVATVFATGNLRKAFESLARGIARGSVGELATARLFSMVEGCFLAGTVVGTFLTQAMGGLALLLALVPIAASGAVITLRFPRR